MGALDDRDISWVYSRNVISKEDHVKTIAIDVKYTVDVTLLKRVRVMVFNATFNNISFIS